MSALLASAALAGAGAAHAQAARDYISIVGSSTVYPFATVVAEQFGRTSKFRTPKIESTGTGGGLKLFCNGVGVQHPDIADASRRITQSEIDACARNGVKDIVEIKIGYDGIVVANAKSAPHFNFGLRDLYLGLAKNVPDPSGAAKLVPNPYKKWSEINPKLPAEKIEVLGPPPTSGTRDAFLELVMEPGAKAFPVVAGLGKDAFTAASHTLREDGAYIEAGENDNLIVQKLEANSHQLGIFGYSFLEQNADKIQGSQIDGVAPDFDAIAGSKYPISRPLFFYVKKAHVGVIPGIKEYINEFTSDGALGEYGYLADKGLIPMSDKERKTVVAEAKSLTPMTGVGH
ncbi:MAG TPA: PstS family phosphate ABC transporter substrate-binding protein [Gammaproteobacteria bacterium]|jgi:phosphate transport system substrate-binding protein|nr:PstS family phosphate ABC transporter substrate-binding protein [Gammaproteobacteria bacterium]